MVLPNILVEYSQTRLAHTPASACMSSSRPPSQKYLVQMALSNVNQRASQVLAAAIADGSYAERSVKPSVIEAFPEPIPDLYPESQIRYHRDPTRHLELRRQALACAGAVEIMFGARVRPDIVSEEEIEVAAVKKQLYLTTVRRFHASSMSLAIYLIGECVKMQDTIADKMELYLPLITVPSRTGVVEPCTVEPLIKLNVTHWAGVEDDGTTLRDPTKYRDAFAIGTLIRGLAPPSPSGKGGMRAEEDKLPGWNAINHLRTYGAFAVCEWITFVLEDTPLSWAATFRPVGDHIVLDLVKSKAHLPLYNASIRALDTPVVKSKPRLTASEAMELATQIRKEMTK